MAEFVVRFGIAPADYLALTLRERDAIVSAWNDAATR